MQNSECKLVRSFKGAVQLFKTKGYYFLVSTCSDFDGVRCKKKADALRFFGQACKAVRGVKKSLLKTAIGGAVQCHVIF